MICPVTIRGVQYPSMAAAARALGVVPETVRRARRAGTLHRVGTRRVGVEPMRVRIAGRVFDDAQAAARHFECTASAVYQAIRDGDPDRIARSPIYRPAKAQPIVIGGQAFASLLDADRKLGFSPGYIAQVRRRGSRKGMESVIAAAMRYAAARPAGATAEGRP